MIDFVNNSEPDLTAENLNKLQQDIGTVVSPTEPQGNERLKVWIQKGKNLFNKNNILSGYLLSEDGAITQNATYFVSAEYIPVLAETDIVVSSAITDIYRIAEYDNNKNLIKRTFNDNPSTRYKIKTTSTTAYIKISCTLAQVDNIQVEQNSEATKYEAYIEPKIYVLNNNDVYEEFIKRENIAENWGKILLGYKYMLNDNFLIYTGTVVANFKNGPLNLDVSELNLVTRPNSVQITPSSQLYGIRYDYDNSSATTLKIEMFNNGQIQSYNGNVRFSITIYGEIK